MALGTTYDFNLIRNQILEEAFRDIGVLEESGSLSGDQLSIGNKRLHMIMRNLEARGIFLWCDETVTVPLVVSQAVYTLDAKYLSVRQALRRNSTSTDVQVECISRGTYDAIASKTSAGPPYWLVQQMVMDTTTGLSNVVLTLYPVPNDATETLVVRAERKMKDFDLIQTEADAPSWFIRPLIKILAADLGRAYQRSNDVIADLRREGYALFEECMHRNVEVEDDSTISGYCRY